MGTFLAVVLFGLVILLPIVAIKWSLDIDKKYKQSLTQLKYDPMNLKKMQVVFYYGRKKYGKHSDVIADANVEQRILNDIHLTIGG